MIWLLWACGKDDTDAATELKVADFVPADGRLVAFTPPDDTGSTPIWLLVDGDAWDVRAGEDWDHGDGLDRWDVEQGHGGLVVAGATLLPEPLQVGTKKGGATVEAIGPWSTYYGSFETAVTVRVDDGPLAGEQTLAPGIGLVTPTIDGATLDLVYYE